MAAGTLRALVAAGEEVVLVVTRPDARRGRRAAPSPSPVKQLAAELAIPVTDRLDDLLEVNPDLAVVVAYGRLIPERLLERVEFVNLHFSLLPRWRGAAPVERAILAGDERTGVCLMRVDRGLDTGPVYDCAEVVIGEQETAAELRLRLAALGSELLIDALTRKDGLSEAHPQQGTATVAEKITPEVVKLDFTKRADELARLVRVGGAWTTFRGKRLIVGRALARHGAPPGPPGTLDGPLVAAADGALELVEVQPEGKRAMPAAAWLAGARLSRGERLGE